MGNPSYARMWTLSGYTYSMVAETPTNKWEQRAKLKWENRHQDKRWWSEWKERAIQNTPTELQELI